MYFLGNRISDNTALHAYFNFEKDYVVSLPVCETSPFQSSFPTGTKTSADFSDLSVNDDRDLPT